MKKFNKDQKYFIFLDIDGTTSPYGSQVHPLNKKVVSTLKKAGHKFFLVTGRSWKGSEHVYERLNLDSPIVVSTGALTFHPSNDSFPIKEFKISRKNVYNIVNDKYLMAHSDSIMINCEDEVYMDRLDETLYYDCHVNYATKTTIGDISNFFHQRGAHAIVIGTHQDISQKDYDNALSKYHNLIWREWRSFRNTAVISISVKQASKSLGVKTILDYYNFPQSNTIAFGDGFNDLDMIDYVKYGIKMKNGSDSLDKYKWDETQKICSAGGVGYYLKELFELDL